MKNTKQNFVKRGIVGNKDESIEQAILNLEIVYRHCSDIRTKDLIECALNRLGMELESEEEASKRMKTTLRKRIKEASKLLNATYETTIVYGVATDTQKEDSIIDVCPTLQKARDVIFGLNEEYKKIDGYGIRLFIIPQVIDADSGELVTKKNIMYYRHDSKWVKNFKKEQISRYA